ncbi:MAG TPA: Tn3 family transposase [Ktedonobacteraceae bacterium]
MAAAQGGEEGTTEIKGETDWKTYLEERRETLNQHLKTVEKLLAEGALPDARLEKEKVVITPLTKDVPDEAKGQLYDLLPRMKLPDLLLEIDSWTLYSRHFTHLQTGDLASLMLNKLASYPRQNGLAWALREFGRIERSIFALRWLQSPALRRRVEVGLNKGEARNALARAVCHYQIGEIRDRSYEDQQYRASGLTLVTAAIVLWNTVYLEAAVKQLMHWVKLIEVGEESINGCIINPLTAPGMKRNQDTLSNTTLLSNAP